LSRIFTFEFWRTFWQHALEGVVTHGLLIAGLLVGYFIVRAITFRFIDGALRRFMARQANLGGSDEYSNRLKTLSGLTRSIAGYLLIFILIIMLLDAVGANVTGLITTAGVGGLAIGIGAQRLVKDVISGFFMIIEDQYAVGDYVTIGTAVGVVEDLSLRITRIRDDQGKLWILPNGEINAVVNHSRAPVQSEMEIGVAPNTDPKQAVAAINEACQALYAADRGHLTAAPKAIGVSGWDATKTTIRVSLMTDPRAATLEQIRIREAILERFKEVDISIA